MTQGNSPMPVETISMSGGCACGATQYVAAVPAACDAYLCHCRMCQRASGNVSLALTSLPKPAVNWLSGPDWYASSPIARRPFCATCGSTLGFEYLDSEKCDLTVASFDDPSPFVPTHQFGVEAMHPAWLDISHLPGTRCDDYQPLNDRWLQATGTVPD